MPAIPMKLYIDSRSPNARRARVTATVLRLDVEERLIDLSKGEQKAPEYLALNPNGAVPTLVDGDYVLTESRAIMQYLAAKRPELGLLPSDEQAHAAVMRWQFWDASHFYPPLEALALEKLVKPALELGAPDATKIAEAQAAFRRFGAVLERHLEPRSFIVGDALTVADVSIACSLMYEEHTEVPMNEFPSMSRWFANIAKLEAWKATSPAL